MHAKLDVPNRRPRHARRDLLEQFQPFPAQTVLELTLPPGRPRLSTKPAPTGLATFTNPIGTMRVAWNNAAQPAVPLARMTYIY
jgi:hypothetical protein